MHYAEMARHLKHENYNAYNTLILILLISEKFVCNCSIIKKKMELAILASINDGQCDKAFALLTNNMDALHYDAKFAIYSRAMGCGCKNITDYLMDHEQFVFDEHTFNNVFYHAIFNVGVDPRKFVTHKFFKPTAILFPNYAGATWFMELAFLNEHKILELCIASEMQLNTTEDTEKQHARKALETVITRRIFHNNVKETTKLLNSFIEYPITTRKRLRKQWFPREDATRIFSLLLLISKNLFRVIQ